MTPKSKPGNHEQYHPYPTGYFPDGAKGLVIGTAPPHRFCTIPQQLKEGDIYYFYGSVDNYFWYVLKAIFEPDYMLWVRTKEHCRDFHRNHHFAMCDILMHFTRRGEGADDSALTPIDFNVGVFNKICSKASKVEYLYFTSAQAYNWFREAAAVFNRVVNVNDEKKDKGKYPRELQIQICNKTLKVFILPSPSGSGTRSNTEYIELKTNRPEYKYENYLLDKYQGPFNLLK